MRIARDLLPTALSLVMLGFSSGLLVAIFLVPLGRLTVSVIAFVGMMIAAYALVRVLRRLDASEVLDERDRLGAEGERVVADALDDLKRDGYRVFHDVPPEREARDGETLSNFDHVVVGPTGVFVIETKASRKSSRNGKVVVSADGRVLVDGFEPDRCPITQATTLARAMQRFLERETAMADVPVRPVVIYPDRYIEDREYRRQGGKVWTLNETAFNKWVRSPKENVRLTADQVALLSSRIDAHVRRADASK